NPSTLLLADHWAGPARQLPAQPKRHHNRDIPNKDFGRARGEFPQHWVGDETPLERLIPLGRGAPEYGRSRQNKRRHEPKPAGNRLEKTMDRIRHLGSGVTP